MTVSPLVEVVVGVWDLGARRRFYEDALGLRGVGRGTIEAPVASALWGRNDAVETVTLARPDVPASPRLRLVRSAGPLSRPGRDLRDPGPLGIGFTTRGVARVHERLAAAGVDFVSAPLCLTPENVAVAGPVRYEAFGRAHDGELVVLIERLNAPTPYGTIDEALDASEPLHTSHVVPDLPAASRFMTEVLGQQTLLRDRCQGDVFDRLLGVPPGTAFSFEMMHHPGSPTGRIVLMAFEGTPRSAPTVDPLGRGLTTLRHHCDDLEAVRRRVAPAGGEVVRGPAAIDSPIGRGNVMLVRSPFSTLCEIWEARS